MNGKCSEILAQRACVTSIALNTINKWPVEDGMEIRLDEEQPLLGVGRVERFWLIYSRSDGF